ncbi:MAG: hypothetical protein R6V67_03690 [Spirochaetia bacterium]
MRTARLKGLLICCGVLFLFFPLGAASQTEDMDVPPVVFEYDSPEQREIDSLIPEPEPLLLPEIEFILQEPEKMEISSLQVPISPPAEPLESEAAESSFFSEGQIGVGNNNHLLGDISLYKRGESPHFSFGFSHEGIDGYGDKPSGTGYFHRVEELTGSIRGEGKRGSVEVSGEYREQEKGMQDFSEASSVIHRFISADSAGIFRLTEKVSAELDAEGHFGSRVSAGVPTSEGEDNSYSDPFNEWLIKPEAGLTYRNDWGELRTDGEYGYYYGGAEGESFHSIGGSLGLAFFLKSMDISSRIGVLRDESEGVLYPFNIKAEGMAGELFHYRLEGGYRTERPHYRGFWRSSPLLDARESLPLSHGWKVEGNLGGSVENTWDWSLSGSYYAAENYPMPDDLSSRDIDTGLFTLAVDDVIIGRSGVSFGWNPTSLINVSFSWEGELIGEVVDPEGQHNVSAGITMENEERIYGGSFNGAYRINPTVDLPILEAGAFYRLSDGVIARLEWTDMLGSLVEGGRKKWGEYIEPGMQLRVLMEISL